MAGHFFVQISYSKEYIEAMPNYSSESLNKLSTCHPDLRAIFKRAIEEIDIKILEGVRSADKQHELYNLGRSRCDGFKIKSNHQAKEDGYSWAVDAMPYPIDWNDIPRIKSMAERILEIAEEMLKDGKIRHRLEWGGNWKSFIDMPHYELKPNK